MMTSTAAEFGGRLKIRLGISDGQVSAVKVSSSRLADAARVFRGCSPDDVVGSPSAPAFDALYCWHRFGVIVGAKVNAPRKCRVSMGWAKRSSPISL
ncbi:MAG: hypothetical protein NUV50_09815 [Rhodospirillales bacterium]|nr:hypothetical protein [Rhodospirillales bacterium]